MSQFWKKISITTKFAASFGVLLLLLVMIAITGFLTLRLVHSAEKTIEISTEVKGIVLEMERSMEKARRLHADFFLHYPLIGFAKAQELYAQKSAHSIAEVIEKSNRLKEMLKNPNICISLQENQVDLNLYISSAKRFSDTSAESIQLIRELKDPTVGLEIMFEHSTVALQNEITDNQQTKELFEKMISFSKTYQIDQQRHSMQSAFNTLVLLQKAINNASSLALDQKKKLLRLLDEWQEIAEKILTINVKIRSKINDFSLQTETTEPASAILISLAKEDMGHAQMRISQAHRFAGFIMGVITLTGLLLALSIAKIFNRTITHSIINLTQSAGEFSRGNLNIRADEVSQDELGLLARSFNAMATRIRELVDNLEQKVIERTAELAESEKRFKAIVENTSQGILIIDTTTTEFLYANPAIAGMFGYSSPMELVGKEVADIHPEEGGKNIITDFFNMVAGKRRFASDVPCLRKNKTTFFADIVVGEVNFADKACLAAFFLDTTEKRNLQAQLERARKMEAIGLLAGGVAHDLNNILSGIVSYPELLLLQVPADSALRKPLTAIHESGKRAAAVVSDLLTVARGVASTRETADLNHLILEYLSSPEHIEIQSSHMHITCRKDLDPNLAHISCSPIHIKKCILNLVINAMEAIDHEGIITIATRNQEIVGGTEAIAGIRPGQYAVLSLSDTGHGIKEEDLGHIFEPFYTKKIMGKSGTGLGLAVVWNSIQDHGGTINVESSREGTTFHLFFPATDQQISMKGRHKTLAELRGDGESVLAVDDEPQQLDITKRILKTLNYNVHCIQSGEEAVAFMEKGHADLILLDMIMTPGINGLQTYERILQHHPGQKAIIVSGFAESSNVRMAQSLGVRGFIKKPFSIEQLGQAIKDELERGKINV